MKSLRTWKTMAQSYLLGDHRPPGTGILTGCSALARASSCTPDPNAAGTQDDP